jgi:hypothetical protein
LLKKEKNAEDREVWGPHGADGALFSVHRRGLGIEKILPVLEVKGLGQGL